MLLALDKASFVVHDDVVPEDDVAGGNASKDGRLMSPKEVYRFIRKYVPSFRTYHKDSYMVHRKERKLGGMEERYRRHISPASHAVPQHAAVSVSMSTSAIPAMVAASQAHGHVHGLGHVGNGVSATMMSMSNCRQHLQQLASSAVAVGGTLPPSTRLSSSLSSASTMSSGSSASSASSSSSSSAAVDGKPPKPFVSPTTWERHHNVRQPSTTVVFTSAELQAIREKERAAAFKSTPELHPSASSPSILRLPGLSRGGRSDGGSSISAGSTGSASVASSSSGGSFKSSYQSPFEPHNHHHHHGHPQHHGSHHGLTMLNNRMLTAGASTTSSVSLDLLMDDTSDADASSRSPVSSLSVSPCHSRGDSQDSVTSPSPPASKPSTLRPKRREEIECEELSKDLAKTLPKNDFLSSLLDPGPEHKSPVDYVGGLFDFPADEESSHRPCRVVNGVDYVGGDDGHGGHDHRGGLGHPRQPLSTCERMARLRRSAPDLSDGGPASRGGESAPLPASSAYFTTSEPKAKLLTRYSSDLLTNKPIVHNSRELAEKKDELLERISKKLSVLRAERAAVEEETAMNEALGRAVAERVEAELDAAASASAEADDSTAAVVTRKDREKFRTHVQEIDKITSLLLGLGGRLARAENALANLPDDATDQDKKILEGKRDRLVEQLEEAKQLKENIDKRSRKVSDILSRHLTQEELADYDHFVRMKAKLIVQAREIEEKIKLGEEQMAALRDALVLPAPNCSPLKS